MPRPFRELARHAFDVRREAAVECAPRLRLAVTIENPPDDEELGRDLRRREAEALPLAGMIIRQLAGVFVAVE